MTSAILLPGASSGVRLRVRGTGMVTPIGFTTAASSAAIRGGISAFSTEDDRVDALGQPVVSARLHLPDRVPEHRLRHAAIGAAVEALEAAAPRLGARVTVALITAELRRPGQAIDPRSVIQDISDWVHGRWRMCPVRHAAGSAGGALALLDFASTAAPGDFLLLLGADSLLDGHTLRYLEAAGRLKSPDKARGLVPGEAAAAVVIEAQPSCGDTEGGRRQCDVLGIGFAQETRPVGDEQPCLGEGLAAAIRMAIGRDEWPIDEMGPTYCDLNGEDYRTHEWLLVASRTTVPEALHHPADCVGDVGAASFPLLMGLAAEACIRRRHHHALVWSGADFGARGAVRLGAVA